MSFSAKAYQVGQVLDAKAVRLETAQTKPPDLYTEATLMQDMLSAYKFAKTADERDILREVGGIGTARTRGAVIEAAIKRGYFERQKRGKTLELRITPVGAQVLCMLPSVAKDVTMTAKWERALAMVAAGQAEPAALIAKSRQILRDLVPALLNSEK